MAYTKRLEIRINGTKVLWDVDPEDGTIDIRDTAGFELTVAQLANIEILLKHLVSICRSCPEVTGIEYSSIT